VVKKFKARDIEIRLHEAVPANDGGLSFGQTVETAAMQNIK